MSSTSRIYTDYRNLIQFTPAGRDQLVRDELLEDQPINDNLTGEQARSFYESVVDNNIGGVRKTFPRQKIDKTCLPSSECSSKFKAAKGHKCNDLTTQNGDELRDCKSHTQATCTNTRRSARQTHRLCNDLLKFAQNGELNELKRLQKNGAGVAIDYQDCYGWSALMCAAVSGHEHVIKYLLILGANKNLRNTHGETALDLAVKMSSSAMVKLLKECSYSQKPKCEEISSKFYCEICKCEFSDGDKVHRTSTVHLFNMKLKPKPDPFMIPESNVGYQLMKKSGWDGEKGLGPKCQGQRYPVKTALKRDRSCLGSDDHKQVKAKVTHFKPNDVAAIKSVHKRSERIMSARTASKKSQRRKEVKDREWERNLRLHFNME